MVRDTPKPACYIFAMNILLIEDDQSVAAYIRQGQEASGYTVEWLADGEAGRDRASAGGFF